MIHSQADTHTQTTMSGIGLAPTRWSDCVKMFLPSCFSSTVSVLFIFHTLSHSGESGGAYAIFHALSLWVSWLLGSQRSKIRNVFRHITYTIKRCNRVWRHGFKLTKKRIIILRGRENDVPLTTFVLALNTETLAVAFAISPSSFFPDPSNTFCCCSSSLTRVLSSLPAHSDAFTAAG